MSMVTLSSESIMSLPMGVLMILEGGPLDGHIQVVENLPQTAGAQLTFNIPQFQTFDPNANLTGQGLQATYAFVGPGPGHGDPTLPPNAGSNWNTSWIFSYVTSSVTTTQPPLVTPPAQPAVAVQVGMQATAGLTPDTIPVLTQPSVTMAAAAAMEVDADELVQAQVLMTGETVVTAQADWWPDEVALVSESILTPTPDDWWSNGPNMVATSAMAVATVDGWSVYQAAVQASNPNQLFWPLNVQPADAVQYGTVTYGTALDPWGGHRAAYFSAGPGPAPNISHLLQNPTQPWPRGGAFTMEFWMQTNPMTSGSLATVPMEFNVDTAGTPVASPSWGPSIILQGPGIGVNSFARVNPPSGTGGGGAAVVGPQVGPAVAGDGGWHHIAATYDGIQTWSFYVDGTFQSATNATVPVPFQGCWHVGRGVSQGATNPFIGNLCFVAAYGRALPYSEIVSHYNAAPPLPTAPLFASAVRASNPDLYWRLNTQPAGGTTVITSATYGSPVFAVPDVWGTTDAANFNAQMAIVANYADQIGNGSFTVEMWVRTTVGSGADLMVYSIAGPSSSDANMTSGTGYSADLNANVGRWIGQLAASVYAQYADTTIPDGLWHHLVFTFDPSQTTRVYRDGVVGTGGVLVRPAIAPGYWRLSRGLSNNIVGRRDMSHVAVYRRALGAGEVLAHYDVGRGITPPNQVLMNAKAGIQVTNLNTSYSAAVLQSAPAAYWKLNDAVNSTTAADSSGANKTAQLFGVVIFGGTDPWGASPGSAHFDGTGGSLVSTVAEQVVYGTPFTIELWYRIVSTATGGVMVELNSSTTGTPTGTYNASFSSWPTSGLLNGICWGGPQNAPQDVASTADGNWHHGAFIFDGTNLYIYRDGALRTTLQLTARQAQASLYWRMGRGARTTQWITGDLAHVAIYNRALSPNELAAHFKATGG